MLRLFCTEIHKNPSESKYMYCEITDGTNQNGEQIDIHVYD